MGLVAAAHAETLGETAIAYRDIQLPGFEEFDEPTPPTGDNDGADPAVSDETVSDEKAS